MISQGFTNKRIARILQISPETVAALRAQYPKIDPATLTDLRSAFEQQQLAYLSEIMADAPAIYARHFTAQELTEIVAFYRTPTGAKTLKEMPQAMAEFFALIGPRLQGSSVKITQAFTDILKKRGYAQ